MAVSLVFIFFASSSRVVTKDFLLAWAWPFELEEEPGRCCLPLPFPTGLAGRGCQFVQLGCLVGRQPLSSHKGMWVLEQEVSPHLVPFHIVGQRGVLVVDVSDDFGEAVIATAGVGATVGRGTSILLIASVIVLLLFGKWVKAAARSDLDGVWYQDKLPFRASSRTSLTGRGGAIFAQRILLKNSQKKNYLLATSVFCWQHCWPGNAV